MEHLIACYMRLLVKLAFTRELGANTRELGVFTRELEQILVNWSKYSRVRSKYS
ncbi:hypothetical protein ACDZ29_07175 [Peribacillus sp. RS7]